eukprot:PhM_4_TR11061/c0_g1_i1/m.22077
MRVARRHVPRGDGARELELRLHGTAHHQALRAARPEGSKRLGRGEGDRARRPLEDLAHVDRVRRKRLLAQVLPQRHKETAHVVARRCTAVLRRRTGVHGVAQVAYLDDDADLVVARQQHRRHEAVVYVCVAVHDVGTVERREAGEGLHEAVHDEALGLVGAVEVLRERAAGAALELNVHDGIRAARPHAVEHCDVVAVLAERHAVQLHAHVLHVQRRVVALHLFEEVGLSVQRGLDEPHSAVDVAVYRHARHVRRPGNGEFGLIVRGAHDLAAHVVVVAVVNNRAAWLWGAGLVLPYVVKLWRLRVVVVGCTGLAFALAHDVHHVGVQVQRAGGVDGAHT